MGFRSVVREYFPHLSISEVLEIGENPDAGFAAIADILAAGPVAALYNIGAGSSGIARAIEQRPKTGRPIFVAHDLSVDTRSHLATGTIDAIIDQNADVTIRRTIARLAAAAGSRMLGVGEMIEPRIILMENIPTL